MSPMIDDRNFKFVAKSWRHILRCGTAATLATGLAACAIGDKHSIAAANWPVYGGSNAGQRYSSLDQITPANVGQLTEAWRVETGSGGLQTSPIMIGGILYVCAPDQSVLALDAATGKQIWKFSSGIAGFQPVRGLTFWQEKGERRLFATSSNFLYALDPATGKPVESFGENGRIDLREGLGRDPKSLAVFLTSPGIVYRDVIITGFRTGENAPASPGAIRAYDVRSGAMRWIFHTIPADGDPGAASWPDEGRKSGGGANNWAGMALDDQRGIVYVPTGSAVSDFYGADRHGDNLYANSLVALDAATGKRIWHYQTVHHDLWDRDLSSPPSLLTVTHDGKRVDAVAQAGKTGFLFVFDRVTGKPLFPIEERPVDTSTVPGEKSASTQPYPLLPAPFARQRMTEEMLTKRTPAAHQAVLSTFRELRSEGLYTPLGTDRKTVVFPGTDGGAEWGGSAVDPKRGILYMNAQDVPWLGGLRKNEPGTGSPGKAVYDQQCAACHGPDRRGNPPDFPALIGIGQKVSRDSVTALLGSGRGRMPGFPQLTPMERSALLDFLFGGEKVEGGLNLADYSPALIAEFRKMAGSRKDPYMYTGYEKFRDPDGYPAVVPPWGTLNAIDLNTGQYLWKVPLGEYPELIAAGQGITGSENYGGPLLTASRLLFIGATVYDRKFRAFDSRTGRTIWETQLPYSGVATPITYKVGGRQFVVIATSGSRDPKGPQGSAYVAYALPRSR